MKICSVSQFRGDVSKEDYPFFIRSKVFLLSKKLKILITGYYCYDYICLFILLGTVLINQTYCTKTKMRKYL